VKNCIDVRKISRREINLFLRESVRKGIKKVELENVNGERYIAAGLRGTLKIKINGLAGNDLGAFMDGPEIEVSKNCQDCLGNTMNEGKILINGSCGDILAYGMRGGRIYIKGSAGYRAGVHMKEYKKLFPVIIIGGRVEDYCGEYLAGGVIIILGLAGKEKSPVGKLMGTGMHGGTIYVKGDVENRNLGMEIGRNRWTKKDEMIFSRYLKEYCIDFGFNYEKLRRNKFTKFTALSNRPYGKIYAY